jgi:tetratricopeptide (TPR) repeat protein
MILLDTSEGEPTDLDKKIAETQSRIRKTANASPLVERLGWLYVEKARISNDPGFYKLAEQCAFCLESAHANAPEALLLKGHVWHSLHRFKEAEPLALTLTKARGMAFDFGFLGDVEYDLGNLPAAVDAYQKMMDLRPDLQAYSRVAQARWITGDLTGAIEAMTIACQAGSPLNAEPTSWVMARLALYQFQAGDFVAARRTASESLEIQTNNAAAYAVLARVQLALDEINAAISSAQNAATLGRLPEQQWLLADVLRLAARTNEAANVENELEKHGAGEDPRSYSLYLATRGREPELALRLAERELTIRQDIFTHDALAWALRANGRLAGAQAEMTQALSTGAQDARLFFHAAAIAQGLGQPDQAARFRSMASSFKQMLLPSEQEQLSHSAALQPAVNTIAELSAKANNDR